MNKEKRTRAIKAIILNAGFADCKISTARRLDEEEVNLARWLNNSYHGEMSYMENHYEKRLDPRKLVDGAKSVISMVYNYYPLQQEPIESSYKISKYAQGKDYHKVVRKKLNKLIAEIQEVVSDDAYGRGFVDSAPIMERAWAKNSGLGWIGKNSLLINKTRGSFFFIAHLILNLELIPDHATLDYCGTCTRCIDACPTQAIVEPYQIDSRKCISYLTIELKDTIPDTIDSKNWVFGCDICQDVCPWNKFRTPHNEPKFEPNSTLKAMDTKGMEAMNEELFESIFQGTAVKRAGYKKFVESIHHAKKNSEEDI